MDTKLLKPHELDALLRYPAGRSARLARAGKIPHVTLPNGEIRFDAEVIERLLSTGWQGGAVKDIDWLEISRLQMWKIFEDSCTPAGGPPEVENYPQAITEFDIQERRLHNVNMEGDR